MTAIKLDEDLPTDLVDLLKARGYDATSVLLQGWTGSSDEWLIKAIQSEGRWLFTADKGFSDIRRYAPGSHHGIVFFRADRESRSAYKRLFELLLATLDLSTVPGALVVCSNRGIRIVRPSASENK